MRALLLLVVAVPAFADPRPAKKPSAIDVDATLVHDRDKHTKWATAICACKDVKCGDKVIDEWLRWKLELDLMRGRRGFETYVEAVDVDRTLTSQGELIDDCNGMLRAKPWKRVCEKRLASAAAAFAREAPKAYAPYKSLKFTGGPSENPVSGTIAEININPGRTWDFLAVVGTMAVAREFDVVQDLSDRWAMHHATRGLAVVRRFGPHVAVLVIQSERWGEFEDKPAEHPLAKLFFEKMQAAADKCLAK
jgi:hypothetical protein